MKNADFFPGSFRDISGYVFSLDSAIYRRINKIVKGDYDLLMNSGLYEELIKNELLIPHKEVDKSIQKRIKGKERFTDVYKIIKPEPIPFISYPYEWCFSQLKDSALLTLRIQKKALEYGMSLKDSSAYNVQFRNGKPVFIDTLSFEKYRQGEPWAAYGQFCRHFLAPLALMKYRDIRLNQLLRIYLDGIPLELAGKLLPYAGLLKFTLFTHIYLHSKGEKYFSIKKSTSKKITNHGLLGIIDNLLSATMRLNLKCSSSKWSKYYSYSNYSLESFQHKKDIIKQFLKKINPKTVWDFGSNIGAFSHIASENRAFVISFDNDPVVVEKNYEECVNNKITNILPLVQDINNPSPGIGWENSERISLLDRPTPDTLMALAIIHHLAISNNLSFNMIARYFRKICKSLIIEFIPKSDLLVKELLTNRKDTFQDYSEKSFKSCFSNFFTINAKVKIKGSARSLYLMHRKKIEH